MMVPLPLRREAIKPAPSGIEEDVLDGLSQPAGQRRLPPRLFYDEEGSELFERITQLPEYYLTRTERTIFEQHGDEILAQAGAGLTLIELGAGTAEKTQVLIAALLRRQLSGSFYPVDVSARALEIARERLTRRFPALRVYPLVGDYSEGLAHLTGVRGRKLVLYIGSSIGNYEPDKAAALLRTIRESLHPGDALLLGTDMVKDAAVLQAAYNDPQGVTAAFNLNMLARINRELGADFDLTAWEHQAEWNAAASRIEMHLRSRTSQRVRIPVLGLTISFGRGERIHTENSYKFTPAGVREVLSAGGFLLERSWFDSDGWFGVHIARVLP
jgi:L-histidine N-alpha-methyltransferase